MKNSAVNLELHIVESFYVAMKILSSIVSSVYLYDILIHICSHISNLNSIGAKYLEIFSTVIGQARYTTLNFHNDH